MSQSYAVNRARWSSMDIFEQLGNVYSEVGRSFNAKRHNDSQGCEQAMIRALDLFDATAEILVKQRSPKAKEVLRAKEEYLSVLTNPDDTRAMRSLDNYFMQFAIAARLTR